MKMDFQMSAQNTKLRTMNETRNSNGGYIKDTPMI